MSKGIWDDLNWLTLFVLSQVCIYGFIAIGAGVTVGLAAGAYMATGSKVIGVAFAVWGFVTTLVGQGYVRFFWARMLSREDEPK